VLLSCESAMATRWVSPDMKQHLTRTSPSFSSSASEARVRMGNQERIAESGRGAAIVDMLGLRLLGGTSILLLFPTNCHGVFLFQFFPCGGECRDMRDASVRARELRAFQGYTSAFRVQIKKTQGLPGVFFNCMNFTSVWCECVCDV